MKECKQPHHILSSALLRILSIFLLIAVSACSGLPVLENPPTPTTSSVTPEPTQVPIPQAEVTFTAQIPDGTPVNADVNLNLLDEVTGLSLNGTRYSMKLTDNRHYEIKIPIPVGSVVKYRYTREGNTPAIEYNSNGQQVRYRLLYVSGPMAINDNINAWNDAAYKGTSGRISGVVVDKSSNSPIPNLLISAAGASTLSAADGSFLLEGLAPGTHNMVAYAMDGAYQTFQQGATVAQDSTTPATISLNPAHLVKVTFNVTVPQENVVGVPIRLAGNLYQTGNTFADLAGGISTIASRMPLLNLEPDGRYSLTLNLPAGTDFSYKYTLGDGFWNSEQTNDGRFRLRQMIVPDQDTQVQDTIASWRSSGGIEPISFEVKIPADTPAGDSVSIQFNPYGWTEPIPMWSLGENRWLYVLYSPLNLLGNMAYRYCRNDQCGVADDVATAGNSVNGFPFKTSNQPQNFQDEVSAWEEWKAPTVPTTVVAAEIKPRGADFFAGIEFTSRYEPSWQTRYTQAYQNLNKIGANWIVNTPAWVSTRANPPVLEPLPGMTPLWIDSLQQISEIQSANLNAAVFPTPIFAPDTAQWWQSGKRDFGWWEVWFNRYREFLIHNADLAARSGAKMVILGGDWLTPALPGGTLMDGSPSGVPTDADARWKNIIQDVRTHFSGKVYWALSYPSQTKNPLSLLDSVDGVYLLWSAPLTTLDSATEADMEAEMGRLLDADVAALQNKLQKPMILAVAYPSVDGGAKGCVATPSGACVPSEVLSKPNPEINGVSVNLQQQVDAYNAVFSAVNQRPWISGVVSRGFYPPAALQDKSYSIHGKPATDILWYWYPRLLASSGQ